MSMLRVFFGYTYFPLKNLILTFVDVWNQIKWLNMISIHLLKKNHTKQFDWLSQYNCFLISWLSCSMYTSNSIKISEQFSGSHWFLFFINAIIDFHMKSRWEARFVDIEENNSYLKLLEVNQRIMDSTMLMSKQLRYPG